MHSRPPEEQQAILVAAGLARFEQKADRFSEGRQQASWNQLLYIGIMDALGYSKNQQPFRKLARLLPFEALHRYTLGSGTRRELKLQAMLFGVAGLLPSQDPRLLIQDDADRHYLEQLENFWQRISKRMGVTCMSREEWRFFRLRPINFPSRRIAGVSVLLHRFLDTGIPEHLLAILDKHSTSCKKCISIFEGLFICTTNGYWAEHYQLDGSKLTSPKPTLIGAQRAREIVINVVLPALLAYSGENNSAELYDTVLRVYQQYPKSGSNEIIRNMIEQCLHSDNTIIQRTIHQQGLLHLYHMFCRHYECDRCNDFIKEQIASLNHK